MAEVGRVRETIVYRKAIEENFRFLKRCTRLDQLLVTSLALPLCGGYLAPVCELHAGDSPLISLFSRWRLENSFAYPSQFPVTDEGTASWLRSKLLDVPDRLLFLVLDHIGKPVGHLGLANCLNDDCEVEIDNVVRGEKQASPGIMSEAMQVLVSWTEETIGPKSIFLRVFDDNDRAVGFYRKLGFQEDQKLPLRKHIEGECVSYRPLDNGDTALPDKSFLRMVYRQPDRCLGDKLILTAGPSISGKEAWFALDAARSGWNSEWNKYIQKFETSFADYIGTRYALSTSSCTGALHLALAALGIGPGDEVIVPDVTWVATANAVVYVGATPIFADIEAGSWCLDPVSFESKITSRTKAVMPVHLYGHPAQMGRIMEIAKKHNLRVIEDAAPAIGAEFEGRKTGTFGDFAGFSFQGAKLMVTGEGGMLVTNNEELFRKAYTIWDQGRRPGTFWIEETGFKYKMANVQAALGLGQLERVDEMIEAKRRIFSWYLEDIGDVRGIRLNREMPWARSIYWMSSIEVEESASISRDELRKKLRERNVDTRSVFPAISQYPVWPVVQEPEPVAHRIGDRAMNLPSGVCLKRDQVAYICRCIRGILA
ncbi:MAG: GNAT family N-acetyltransferase [Terracidiphilus sp.]